MTRSLCWICRLFFFFLCYLRHILVEIFVPLWCVYKRCLVLYDYPFIFFFSSFFSLHGACYKRKKVKQIKGHLLLSSPLPAKSFSSFFFPFYFITIMHSFILLVLLHLGFERWERTLSAALTRYFLSRLALPPTLCQNFQRSFHRHSCCCCCCNYTASYRAQKTHHPLFWVGCLAGLINVAWKESKKKKKSLNVNAFAILFILSVVSIFLLCVCLSCCLSVYLSVSHSLSFSLWNKTSRLSKTYTENYSCAALV